VLNNLLDINNNQEKLTHLSNDKLLEFQNAFKNNITDSSNTNNKHYHALMLFESPDNTPYNWTNTQNIYFTNGVEALNAYTNTPCPASQLISEETKEQLLTQMNNMIKNYNSKTWLNNNLLPFL